MISKTPENSKTAINSAANKEILKQTLLDEEKPEPSLADRLREKKKKQRTTLIKRTSIVLFLIFFAWFLWWGFAPFKGSVRYATCKLLIELSITYPQSLRYTEASSLSTGSIRIWFTHTDAFGMFRMESFICTYGKDPVTGTFTIAQAKWGNIDIDQKQLDNFNKVLPALVAGQYYDRTAPAPLATNIKDLQFETERFRKVKILDLISRKQ